MITIDLKTRRSIQNIKQSEIAAELGISYQQYQKYEYGLIRPNIKRFLQIAKILNISRANIITCLQLDYCILNNDEIIELIG